MSTDDFYARLPAIDSFAGAFNETVYHSVPDDWIIAVTDVVNSTVAIDEGRYKDVTIAGAIGMVAISNHLGHMNFPYIFGGDGMAFLVPGSNRRAILAILADTRSTVASTMNLDLRAGVVKVADVRRDGHDVTVARVQVAPRYVQAVVGGTGLEYAERLLKGGGGAIEYVSDYGDEDNRARVHADFRGFSCRWLDIPSSHGETVSLIVKSTAGDRARALADLEEVARLLGTFFEDPGDAHPLTIEMQRTRGAASRAEARILSGKTRGLAYFFRMLKIRIEVTSVRLASALKIPLRATGKTLSRVAQDNIENSDVRKLDGTLKLTFSATTDVRQKLTAELDRLCDESRIQYGVHVSDRAIMTCVIHTNHEQEVHFVDSADGGYASAARMLKERIGAIQK